MLDGGANQLKLLRMIAATRDILMLQIESFAQSLGAMLVQRQNLGQKLNEEELDACSAEHFGLNLQSLVTMPTSAVAEHLGTQGGDPAILKGVRVLAMAMHASDAEDLQARRRLRAFNLLAFLDDPEQKEAIELEELLNAENFRAGEMACAAKPTNQ